MLAKLTSKNRLTLPKAVTAAVEAAQSNLLTDHGCLYPGFHTRIQWHKT